MAIYIHSLLFSKGTPNCLELIVIEILILFCHFVKKFDSELLIRMSERAKLKILTGLFFEDPTTILAFIALRMIQLLDLVVRKLTILISTISSCRTLEV